MSFSFHSASAATAALEAPVPHEVSLSDFSGMEVLGSVPIWVLSGLRLERVGHRMVSNQWPVGVYRMDVPYDD